MSAADAHYERRANQMEENVIQLAGIQWTKQDALDFYTNGVSTTAEPHAALLSTNIFENLAKTMRTENFQWRFNKEHLETHLEFTAANTAHLALVDEVTRMKDFRFANALSPGEPWAPSVYSHISSTINWVRYYRWKLIAAEYQNNAPAMLDCLRRMRTICSWVEAAPGYPDWLVAEAMNAITLAGTALALPQLPDEALLELRDDIVSHRDHSLNHLRRALVNERIVFNNTMEFITSQNVNEHIAVEFDYGSRYIKKNPYMLKIWLNCERLAFYNNLHAALLLMDGLERFTCESVDEWIDTRAHTRLIFARMMEPSQGICLIHHARSTEHCNTALAGIAIEQYRRANGALPESLDALVPEYLDSVPLSSIKNDNAPLMYKHGEFEFQDGDKRFLVDGYMVCGPVYRKSTGAFNSFTVALGPVEKLEPLKTD